MAKSQGSTLFKIPMGAKQITSTRMIRVETPFDWILIKNGKVAFLDTKRLKDGNLTPSKITKHQYQALLDCHQAGTKAGYIVWFEDKDQMTFFSAPMLDNIVKKYKKEDGLVLGKLRSFDLDLIWK
jgi:penicillin-binding protein-related factor A (putative recombinase)